MHRLIKCNYAWTHSSVFYFAGGSNAMPMSWKKFEEKQILIDLLVHINVKRVHEIEENGTVVKLVYTVGDNAEPKRNHCFAPSINK